MTTSPRSTRHRLEGLETDNLMAFLALLGTLRALECAEPNWHARAGFDFDRSPLRPYLQLRCEVSQDDVAEAVVRGITALMASVDLAERTDVKQGAESTRDEIRRALDAEPPRSRFNTDLMAALSSDAGRARDETGAISPLCFPSVARVSFLGGMRELIAAETPTSRDGSTRSLGSPTASVERALFAPWQRLDRPPGLRFDSVEGRQHAFQWVAPEDDKPTTEHGAARLAIIGLACFPVLPSGETAQTRTPVAGGSVIDGKFTLTWPLWQYPMSLAAIGSLLLQQGLADTQTRQRLGVVARMRTRRIGLGKYITFTCAEEVA